MTDALIIGGGIAGAVTAMALKKAGHNPAIYEAYPTGADDIGAFLTIMNNGLDALRAIDAHQPVIDNSFAANEVEFLNGQGTRLGLQPLGGDGDINGPRTLTRATLYRILHDEATRRGIPVIHDKRLIQALRQDDKTIATFADGSTAAGDLLVGADGIHSITRSIIDPTAPAPRYAGLNIAYGYAHDADLPTAANSYRMIFGGQAFFGYTTAPDGQTWWFARVPAPELTETVPQSEIKTRLTEAFAADNSPAGDIVAATTDEIHLSNAYDVPTTPTWHRDSMILVGDAAHAASPAAGQGASMAIEDSVTLAQCLRDITDHDQAFRTYEHLRRPRVEQLVATSAEDGARAAQGTANAQDVTDRQDTRAWLYRHHIEWDTRVTPVA
ncbi:Salicylate hydroxylase [Alloactinosynnema sp. L-07]|uniref:FAD-dependent oxidoreductase n=1 Tax=Alloactinosynnema sp. L-07 TaxID=1653480 RepID=UPI00065EF9D3|nr:FAD-dependent monooxygenase [Alloactinosynnema sp. L-07]CRK57859.1 Salicylate hydroxylase [Alloactinosynnema sp. L-07]